MIKFWLIRLKDYLIKKSSVNKISEAEVLGHVKSIIAEEWVDLIGLMRINPSPEYWIRFITSLCYVESNYDQNMVYPEGYPSYYDSIGLMQLSEVDFTIYGHSAVNLRDGYENIKFGIFILNRIAYARRKVIFDDDHYWATLRPNRNPKKHAKFLDKMTSIVM